ncbi:prolyl oligopeptidase family serine peptidase [Wenzhouxiangella limi]|uniref:S9 family peptidase n=1 Tax=Wenzhouxiangella limi TaxID=2707351 RepID=A0A845UZQ3_9GAMM|nr:prolyl oligopeptidase family serine peptidase [Wenzhouxiangella limi]NDY94536.1 S9 family peptidase [Wenzhouxiangella limi]
MPQCRRTRSSLHLFGLLAGLCLLAPAIADQAPVRVQQGNLVMENIPDIPPEVRERLRQYQNVRSASLSDFGPDGGIYITTRFGETSQIHHVARPMGARRQVTFYDERTGGASVRPDGSGQFMFSRDVGGDEFYQGFLFDPKTGTSIRFTESETRNQGFTWSPDGDQVAWASATWEQPDYTIWVADPSKPDTRRRLVQAEGATAPREWSPDGRQLLLGRYISINESRLFLLDLESGEMTRIQPDRQVAYGAARFSADGSELFVVSDADAEFRRILAIDLSSGEERVVVEHPWDVQAMDISPDGKLMAYTINAGGVSELHLLDLVSGQRRSGPQLPAGRIGSVRFSPDGQRLGFSHSYAGSPGDAWTFEPASGELLRWTESEVGGLDTSRFRAPELIQYTSFDGLEIPAFVHRPDGDGPHPVIVSIHGGPESQARPGFSSTYMYWVHEMGAAVVVPNVRGSAGYGNEYVNLDNVLLRENSVFDIGALLDWIDQQPDLDEDRVVVYGGSYGGYMVLASLMHYSDRLAGGVNIVGISNFVTFLENTAGYRRDLRRVEYGDERDPEVREHLESISPSNNAERITAPLFIIQGANDPRVPASEAEQILEAVRGAGGNPWYLLALDEGHGFARQSNREFRREAETLFLTEVLGLDP